MVKAKLKRVTRNVKDEINQSEKAATVLKGRKKLRNGPETKDAEKKEGEKKEGEGERRLDIYEASGTKRLGLICRLAELWSQRDCQVVIGVSSEASQRFWEAVIECLQLQLRKESRVSVQLYTDLRKAAHRKTLLLLVDPCPSALAGQALITHLSSLSASPSLPLRPVQPPQSPHSPESSMSVVLIKLEEEEIHRQWEKEGWRVEKKAIASCAGFTSSVSKIAKEVRSAFAFAQKAEEAYRAYVLALIAAKSFSPGKVASAKVLDTAALAAAFAMAKPIRIEQLSPSFTGVMPATHKRLARRKRSKFVPLKFTARGSDEEGTASEN